MTWGLWGIGVPGPGERTAAHPSTYEAGHPLGQIAANHPNVDLHAWESPQGIKVNMIQVAPEHQGKGYAGAALRDLISYADAQGLPIALTPGIPEGRRGMSQAALKRWYSSHGFVPNKGRNKDWNWAESMIRPARAHRTAMPMMYHHTSPENAEAIRRERKFRPNSEYDEFTYFSDKPDGNGSGWGEARVDVNVPDYDFEYDFEEDPYQHDGGHSPPAGETFWRARSKDIKPEWIAQRTAMPAWHHLTNDPDFRLNPRRKPKNFNNIGRLPGSSGDLGRGVFLTKNPDRWVNMPPAGRSKWTADRPYIADIDAPEDLQDLPGVWYDYNPDHEIFVPADQFHHLTVQRVRPRTAMPEGKSIMIPVNVVGRYRQRAKSGGDYRTGINPELMDSVGRHGIMNPLEVMTDGDKATLADGHHRLDVAMALGHTHVPVQFSRVPPIVMGNMRKGQQGKSIHPHLAPYLADNISHTAQRTAMPSPPSSSSLPSVGHCGNNWWGEGGCGHLALAFANMYPDMKIGAEYDPRFNSVNHAWAYGPDSRSHDFMGTHDGHPPRMDRGGEIREDVSPEDLAADMRIDYNPDEDHRWDNPEIAQAGHLINRHWHGDDDYGEDSHDGYYDPDRAENRGTHRTAMPAWYHVSPHDLPMGTLLTPGGGQSSYDHLYDYEPERKDHVWVDRIEHAPGWSGSYVYQVEPTQEPRLWNEHAPENGWVTPSARIVKKYPESFLGDVAQASDPDNPEPFDEERFLHNWNQQQKEARLMTAAVTVYTQPNCVQCTMTKKQLDRLGIEHSTVDVTADPEAHAYVRGLGYTAAPVVVVGDGEDHWSGFKPERLKALSGE